MKVENMNSFEDIGIQIPRIYLPRKGSDLTKWAVIACDQFTSEPDYWQKVERFIGKAPSTYHLIFPEAYLDKPGEGARIQKIHENMHAYLDKGILQPHDGMVYVQRTTASRTRHGLMLNLDLEHYDFTKGSTSMIRASEGTIIERLPPRMKIRTGAALECPHILVLIDDPAGLVIEPVRKAADDLEKLYDFDLMFGSGHLTGYGVSNSLQDQVVKALRHLAQPEQFIEKYGLGRDTPVLLFAMGDGNHSFATAKAVWERIKPEKGLGYPARYALVELVNVHDQGLDFEPIHRLLFGLKKELFSSLRAFFGADISIHPFASGEDLASEVDKTQDSFQTIGLFGGGKDFTLLEISHPRSNLPVGTLEAFLEVFMKESGADRIDYVHGGETVSRLGAQPGNAGFYLPRISKSDLFKTVILDGALPRKTFSMGEAQEKRFYMETRKII
jgi:hypothetical protein